MTRTSASGTAARSRRTRAREVVPLVVGRDADEDPGRAQTSRQHRGLWPARHAVDPASSRRGVPVATPPPMPRRPVAPAGASAGPQRTGPTRPSAMRTYSGHSPTRSATVRLDRSGRRVDQRGGRVEAGLRRRRCRRGGSARCVHWSRRPRWTGRARWSAAGTSPSAGRSRRTGRRWRCWSGPRAAGRRGRRRRGRAVVGDLEADDVADAVGARPGPAIVSRPGVLPGRKSLGRLVARSGRPAAAAPRGPGRYSPNGTGWRLTYICPR